MIEWLLAPGNDSERSISYAMKLYGANQMGDNLMEHWLSKDDKSLDRRLKELQTRKLAGEMGLDYRKFMSDDAAEENRTTQAAIAYGAKPAPLPKFTPQPTRYMHPSQFDYARGPAAMAKNVGKAFGIEAVSLAELMKKPSAGMIGKILRTATYL